VEMTIDGFGSAHPLPDAAIQPDKDLGYRLLFDCREAAEQPDDVNPGLSHAARLINLFGASGIQPREMRLAAILSGPAAKVALDDDTFRRRFGRNNPDRELIRRLHSVGVAIYVCGQSLIEHDYRLDATNEDVTVASSALTVLANLQLEGYALMSY
jgi:intracellular sulfur oxidation DsrE/DsrF family protein